MPDEMLSFPAGGSTPGLVKPVAYDTIEVHKIENSEIRKIAHDVQITPPASERLVQRPWHLDVIMARWVMDGKLRRCISGHVQNEESAIHRLCIQERGLAASNMNTNVKNGGVKNGR